MAIDLAAVRDRIDSLQLFNTVGDVVDAAMALETSARPPAAFVAAAAERAEPNRTQGIHQQWVDQNFAVLGMAGAERKDQRQRDIVEILRTPVIESLAGWTPPGGEKPIAYVGYRVLRLGEGLVWFELSFTTGWRLRGTGV